MSTVNSTDEVIATEYVFTSVCGGEQTLIVYPSPEPCPVECDCRRVYWYAPHKDKLFDADSYAEMPADNWIAVAKVKVKQLKSPTIQA